MAKKKPAVKRPKPVTMLRPPAVTKKPAPAAPPAKATQSPKKKAAPPAKPKAAKKPVADEPKAIKETPLARTKKDATFAGKLTKHMLAGEFAPAEADDAKVPRRPKPPVRKVDVIPHPCEGGKGGCYGEAEPGDQCEYCGGVVQDQDVKVEFCCGDEPDCCEGEPGEVCPGCGKIVPVADDRASVPWTEHDTVERSAVPVAEPARLADKLKAKIVAAEELLADKARHVIVEARAGSGKTTTLVEGMKRIKGLPCTLIPSPQQAAVWEAMEKSRGARTVAFVAFNKSIADELKSRVPPGCEAMTMHSMGFKAVRKAFTLAPSGGVSEYVTHDIVVELLGMPVDEVRKTRGTLLRATAELVSLCKTNLVPLDAEDDDQAKCDELLDELAEHYDVTLHDEDARGHRGRSWKREVYDMVPRVLARARDPRLQGGRITYDDMIWLPVSCGLPIFRYDVLLGDEVQDWNPCQFALARRAGSRLILCGDRRQAIYGFTGAGTRMIQDMEEDLGRTDRGVTLLPLTVTRRCGKAIVVEANRIVPDLEAFETNPPGRVSQARYPTRPKSEGGGPRELPYEQTYLPLVQDADMVLCRVNAPLVSQCFRFLRQGKKAFIQGRDVGAGLITLVVRLMKGYKGAGQIPELIRRLEGWLREETAKETAKSYPNEAKLIALSDKHDCLVCFTEGALTTEDVMNRIGEIFTDNKDVKGIRLSSIHKAKGLEARRVFLLRPEGAGCPHPMAKTPWQVEQEHNLLYVAITRAIEELVYVS